MKQTPVVDRSKCTGCKRCSEVCFLGSLRMGVGGKAEVAKNGACIACGHCVAVCPAGAISHPDLRESPSAGERADFDQLMGLLRMRRSRREFTDQPVSLEMIEKLLDGAVQAPSAINAQSVEFAVIADRDVLRSLSETAVRTIKKLAWLLLNPLGRIVLPMRYGKEGADALKQLRPEVRQLLAAHRAGQDPILYDAPCAILVHTSRLAICGRENAVYCGANILLAAEALGLGACVIGFVTEPARQDPQIKRIAGIPADHDLCTTIIVGHPRFPYARPASKNSPKVHYIGH